MHTHVTGGMTMLTDVTRFLGRAPLPALLAALALGVAGCGDDDDDPAGPQEPEPGPFQEDVAIAQAAALTGLVTVTLDAVPGYADGVGAKVGDDEFVYNEDEDRWETSQEYGQAGYTWTLDYFVQYLNAGNLPVMDVEDAQSMRYWFEGTAEYGAGGVTSRQEHSALLSVVGLHTDTLTVYGGGDYTVEYAANGETSLHEAEWALDQDGVVQPELGCPAGEVTADLAPYELRVTFDGSESVDYVLVDDESDPVAGGTGSTTIDCGI